VERLGAAANVDEFAQRLHCSLAQGGLTLTARQKLVAKPLSRSCQHGGIARLHSRPDWLSRHTVSPLPDTSARCPLLGDVESSEDGQHAQRGSPYWHTLACIRRCQRGAVCFVRAPVRQSKNLPDTVAGAQTRPEYCASNQSERPGSFCQSERQTRRVTPRINTTKVRRLTVADCVPNGS
jgi:hypothetical protein